jgi:hypothetical protein
VAPTLIQQKKELEEEKKKDQLSKKLNLRPSKDELQQKNILKGAITPNLDSNREETGNGTFEQRQTQLKSILKKRPEKSQLEQNNILKGKYGPSQETVHLPG